MGSAGGRPLRAGLVSAAGAVALGLLAGCGGALGSGGSDVRFGESDDDLATALERAADCAEVSPIFEWNFDTNLGEGARSSDVEGLTGCRAEFSNNGFEASIAAYVEREPVTVPNLEPDLEVGSFSCHYEIVVVVSAKCYAGHVGAKVFFANGYAHAEIGTLAWSDVRPNIEDATTKYVTYLQQE